MANGGQSWVVVLGEGAESRWRVLWRCGTE